MYKLLIILILFYSCGNNRNNISNVNDLDSTTASLDTTADIIYDYSNQNELSYTFTELDFPIDDESRFVDADYYEINISPKGDYNKLTLKIKSDRQNFKNKYLAANTKEEKQKIIEKAGKYITETLVNEIIPFWYGMPWDLAGYSDIPNKGEVGCSYFVSNTMKHCGFNVNRYHLAQQNTKNIALSIQLNDSILTLKGEADISTVKNYFLKNKKEGLYYVGLDCHVGYLLFKKGELFFIQSNYSYPLIVLTEFTEKSEVFMSNYYYIADITWNDELIKKWMLFENIIVRKD